MPFFKDLRRFSKAGFARDNASDQSNGSNGSYHSNGSAPTAKSTSTLDSANGASATPLSLHKSSSNITLSKSNGSVMGDAPPVPARPSTLATQNKRYSTASSYSGSMTTAPKVPTSLYAPRVLSIADNTWVHQKVLLVYGQTGAGQKPLDGTLTITHHQDGFPPTQWPVTETHFKALIHLVPGPNDIRLDFASPKLIGSNSPMPHHFSRIRINYLPMTNSPPLQLVMLLGKDSPGTFDSPPEKIQREGNDLETAKRKYRTAAYLWSAFTSEQMYRNGFGRRTFRFEEEYQTGTLSGKDRANSQMRNEAKIHVVRCDKTVAELRDLDRAQQNPNGKKKGELYSIAMDAVRAYFKPQKGQTQYVSVLLVDSHWDKNSKIITGHAALGGGTSDIKLGIFGSHALHSYPNCLEEVVPALSDCTRTNTAHVAMDCGEDSGTWWQAACIGIGAHLHEVGHALGSPHQSSGVMLRDYWTFNRTFLTAEPFSTRTKQQGLRPCLPASECGWHRLDTLRYRSHPCFRLPSDTPMHPEDGVQVWPVDQGRLFITAKSGISFIEIRPEGHDNCDAWLEYLEKDTSEGLPRQITVTESELRGRLPNDRKNKKIKVEIFSQGGGKYVVEDVSKAYQKVKLPQGLLGRSGFYGPKMGQSQMEGSKPQELILSSTLDQTKIMTSMRVYHGFALDGIEFFYEDRSSQLFGARGGKAGGSEFVLDTRRGETLTGFYVRAGLWVDGLAIITSTGRQSEFFGNANGGSGHSLMPPRGYSIAGVSGSSGKWVDGFSLIITR